MPTKTFQPRTSTVKREWKLIDAKDQILGRLASHVVVALTGKGKRIFSPHVDCGDFVVVVNAEGIKIKGNNKPTEKIDFRHSGYPGGETMTPYSRFLKTHPDRAIWLAVSGMLPKNRLRKRQLTRLRIFKGSAHPHGAHFANPAKSETQAAPNS